MVGRETEVIRGGETETIKAGREGKSLLVSRGVTRRGKKYRETYNVPKTDLILPGIILTPRKFVSS